MTCTECPRREIKARGLCNRCYHRSRAKGGNRVKGIPADHMRDEFKHFDPGSDHSNRHRARVVAERIGATWLAVERAAYRGGWFA